MKNYHHVAIRATYYKAESYTGRYVQQYLQGDFTRLNALQTLQGDLFMAELILLLGDYSIRVS